MKNKLAAWVVVGKSSLKSNHLRLYEWMLWKTITEYYMVKSLNGITRRAIISERWGGRQESFTGTVYVLTET